MTNITRQLLWASALVMVASGDARAVAPLAAIITQRGLPYFAFPQAVNSKPLGQFAFNTHVCLTGKTYTWNGLQFFQYVLPSGAFVYTLAGKGIFAPDPAGDKKCLSQVASTSLPANVLPPVQSPPQPAPTTSNPQQARAPAEEKSQAEAAAPGKASASPRAQEAVRVEIEALANEAIASANMNNCEAARTYIGKMSAKLEESKINVKFQENDHTEIEQAVQNKVVDALKAMQPCDMKEAYAEGHTANTNSIAPSGDALAVIVQSGFPYSASPQDIYNKPPLGQFTFKEHVCVKKEMPTWNRLKFIQFILPSGETVYSEDLFVEDITRDPPGDKKCELLAHQRDISTKSGSSTPQVERAPSSK